MSNYQGDPEREIPTSPPCAPRSDSSRDVAQLAYRIFTCSDRMSLVVSVERWGRWMDSQFGKFWSCWAIILEPMYIYIYTYLLVDIYWFVVDLPLRNIWKSVGMMISNTVCGKHCSKPPIKRGTHIRKPPLSIAFILSCFGRCDPYGKNNSKIEEDERENAVWLSNIRFWNWSGFCRNWFLYFFKHYIHGEVELHHIGTCFPWWGKGLVD